MLTAASNQLRVCALSIKYNIMREMLNKVTFVTNIVFMMLNNASFIVQWVILFRLKEDIGGYTMDDVMLLWGLAASSFGLSRILFDRIYRLPELIIKGQLDAYLVQPKNVLLSVATSSTNVSAIGDLLYGIVIVCIFSFSIKKFALFILFVITGAIVTTAFALIMGNLSFFLRLDVFGGNMINIMVSFSTYPDGIFKGAARFLIYFIVPTGMAVYMPVHIIRDFDIGKLFIVLGYTVFITALAVFMFYRGIKRYSSSSLMESRM